MQSKKIDVFERTALRKILDNEETPFVKLSGKIHVIENKSNDLYRDKNGVWKVKTLVDGKHEGRINAIHILNAFENDNVKSSNRYSE